MDWHVADDLPFQDIRVGLAYVLIIATAPIWLIRKQSREPLMPPDAVLALFGFAAVSYIAWISIFAIYRYIVLLEILGPILIFAAVAMWPISARARMVTAAILLLLCAGSPAPASWSARRWAIPISRPPSRPSSIPTMPWC